MYQVPGMWYGFIVFVTTSSLRVYLVCIPGIYLQYHGYSRCCVLCTRIMVLNDTININNYYLVLLPLPSDNVLHDLQH